MYVQVGPKVGLQSLGLNKFVFIMFIKRNPELKHGNQLKLREKFILKQF